MYVLNVLIAETLATYFMSGRPYKVILERLHTVHGVKKRLACYVAFKLPELKQFIVCRGLSEGSES